MFENIGWTVGNYCNAKCGHCYSWKLRKDSKEYLTIDDIQKIITQLLKLGVKTVNLGGNEPIYTNGPNLADTLLPYIIRSLNHVGILVGLTTNGISFSWLDKYYPNELKMINDIDFSLDSPFQIEHDLNRGNKLYHLTIEAIQKSLDLGIDCSVIACGMKKNFNREYLSAYLDLCKILGCEFRINTLKPVEKSLIQEMPTIDQFYEGFEFLMQNTDCITLGESCLTALTQSGSKGCPCGHSSFRINAKDKNGKISINPCVYAHDYKVGDLLTEDIFDIINAQDFQKFANRRKNYPQACIDRNCELIEICKGGCSSRAYLTYGDLNQKDPYCPKDFLEKNQGKHNLPLNPSIGQHDGIRVHENYLCTWIGNIHENYECQTYFDLNDFYQKDTHQNHISSHQQSFEQQSLVQINFNKK